ncbi:hypothetical protein [Streptomyces sp. NPDC091268]|uniref:hypothetical protein n=1 Tax=Streptomyces sp. NPDC091268 TaxID=3365979 RepID=UPI00381155F9
MAVAINPRPLNDGELGVVQLILAADFAGAPELRSQLEFVRVVAQWGEESASVDLTVLEGGPRSSVGNGVIPVDASVLDETGELFGEILLWVSDGQLSAIEYAWYGDEPPRSLPDVELISTSVNA